MVATAKPEDERRGARYFAKWFAVTGGICGVLMFVGQGFYTTYSVRGIDGLHIEKVKILRYDDSGTGGCGRGSDPVDLQFESANPVAGQPAVFWVRGECVPALDKGDVIPLAREIKDGKVVKYWIDPATSYSDAFWISFGSGALAFTFVFAVCWIGLGIRLIWLRYFWHD